jgi:hypothetical protein
MQRGGCCSPWCAAAICQIAAGYRSGLRAGLMPETSASCTGVARSGSCTWPRDMGSSRVGLPRSVVHPALTSRRSVGRHGCSQHRRWCRAVLRRRLDVSTATWPDDTENPRMGGSEVSVKAVRCKDHRLWGSCPRDPNSAAAGGITAGQQKNRRSGQNGGAVDREVQLYA